MCDRSWIASRLATFAVFVFAASTEPLAAQARYTYTVIADVSDCFNVGPAALGNNGEAAFMAYCPMPASSPVVRKGDGVFLTDIYVASAGQPYSLPDSMVSINDVGVVAFGGGPTGGGSAGYAIVYGAGGPLTVVADTSVHTQWINVGRPSINNSNVVAFHAVPAGANSYNTVIRAANATFTTIAQPGMAAPGLGAIYDAAEPALNNVGQVEFLGNTTSGVYGIFRGAGAALTKIVSGQGNSFSGINDAGRVAFASGNSVRSGTGGSLTTIALAGTVFHSFSGIAAINNSNAVAFSAQTYAGPFGVFVGDGTVTQPVVQTGDVLAGLGTATWVGIGEESINDHGQVVFGIQYDNGGVVKSAIIRADPVLPQIIQLKLASTVAGCKTVPATVVLDRATPPGGVVIEIDETNGAASAPATFKIASNKTSGKFVMSTTPVSSNQSGTVTTVLGDSTQTKPLTVRPMGVQSVNLSPNPVVGGNPVTGTAVLECAAAPAGIGVTLSSSKPAVAQPAVASLLFPQGTKSMTFQVNTSAVPASTNATIAATANGIKKSKSLTVTP